MEVVALLQRIANLSDLLALVRALGHEVAWQELPPDSLPVEPQTAALVGRSGGFEWLAISAHPAEEAARRLSAALAQRGRLTGVLSLDREARHLALAITVDHTAAMSLALEQPAATDRERWQRLASIGPAGGLAFALRALEVIEGEDTGRRFFVAFGRVLERMADGIAGTLSLADRRALALIQLTRVLFLYFVQAKGWLDGRHDFLRRAVDDALARRRRLHRHLFRPLFFGTLNRPAAARRRSLALGAIPFLNGGLFEPHTLERRWRGDIPDDSWREAFDTLFERFHFTVHEGPDAAGVAPDMLGRVFEGVMARDDRRATGSYYTPAALVRRMVDAALIALVAERCRTTPQEARERLERPDQRVRQLLADVTVLDPAVGSGAFLLGALERLTELQGGDIAPAELRRRILARNLFGVDLNPMAVRLAELRLWLAVIAADDTVPPGAVAPLPNLDGQIRQGDSLLDPTWALAGVGATPGGAASELSLLRLSLAGASGPEKGQLQRRLRRAEVRVFEERLDGALARLELAVAECLQSARAVTLFGERRGLDRSLRRRLRTLRSRLAEVRRLRRRLQRDGEVPGFSCECHFGDVLARDGFDLVVGNPPWVRAEHLPGRLRQQLTERYGWWRTSGRGFAHQPDLALAFVERSSELLAPGGVMALLLPSKVATAQYARRMRGALTARFTLHALADLSGDPAAAFDATTYPTALIAAKALPPPASEVSLTLAVDPRARCPQDRLAGGGPWVLATPPLLDALALARADHPRLGERFAPQLGVKTGANLVFLDPPAEIEPALLCHALRGRDVAPFIARPRVRLFFPHGLDGLPFARLPENAMRHVRRHARLLRARVDYQGGPLWTLFRVRGAVAACRVVWPDLARCLGAAALIGRPHDRLVPLNTCYVLALPDRAVALRLTAWLNSTWVRALARTAADRASGGFARFNARVVADLPLPPSVLADSRLSALAERGAEGGRVQEELDDICAEHLGLPRHARGVLAQAAGPAPQDRGGITHRD